MEVKKALIPAAGLGTRLRPLSEKMPKELFPLGKKLVLDYALEESVHSGIEKVGIIVGPGKERIRDRYTRERRDLVKILGQIVNFVDIAFVDQSRPLGLGDAICTARNFVGDEPFAVLLPDNVFLTEVPPLAQLQRLFSECSSPCVGTMVVPENRTIFFSSARKFLYQEIRSGVYRIEKFVDDQEQVRPGELCSIGRYILTPLFFDYCSQAKKSASGELRETDVLREYLGAGHQLYGGLIEGERFDTGSMEGYIHAFVSFIDRGL